MRKGSFSGVIPMIGLFIMAALMGFQSLPISSAIADEMTQSYTDLSKVAQTKSYGDFYFFNFVPAAAEYSVNNRSYVLGQIGGNTTWNYNDFKDENTDYPFDTTYESIWNLEDASTDYIQNNYGGVSQSRDCSTGKINYTTKVFPSDINNEKLTGYNRGLPVRVRSEIEYTGTPVPILGYSYTFSDAKNMQVICSFGEVNTKYIGDTGGLGYSNNFNASGNRYHTLARETSNILDEVRDKWKSNVGNVTKTNENVCDPQDSDWDTPESNAISAVNSDVKTTFTDIMDDEVDVDGVSGTFSMKSYTLDIDDSTYNTKFDGYVVTWKDDSDPCDPHWHDNGDDPGNWHYHDTEYDLHVKAVPVTSKATTNLTDDKFHIMTKKGWKNLEFNVKYYTHKFQKD